MPKMISNNRIFTKVHMLLGMLLALFLSACAPDSGILGGGSWQASGLQQQPIRTLEVNPKDSQKLYAGDA